MTAPSSPADAMPIMLSRELRDHMSAHKRLAIKCPVYFAVPMAIFEPHEQQAQTNHGQSFNELAGRGGLSPSEAVAILEDRRWHSMTDAAAYERLAELVAAWNRRPPVGEACPHCGGADITVRVQRHTSAKCEKCGATGPVVDLPSQAIAALVQATGQFTPSYADVARKRIEEEYLAPARAALTAGNKS